MDTELLSKMIRELVIEHDSVSLPGIGVFYASQVPASFSDRGYTINPPYRKLTFIQGPPADRYLAEAYARSNTLDESTANAVIGQFLQELNMALLDRKSIVLNGLGKLRATRDNSVFFVPDPDLDIYPDGFGLPPVSLRNTDGTRTEPESPRIVVSPSSVAREQQAPQARPAPVQPQPAPQEPEQDRDEPVSTQPQGAHPRSRWWIWPLSAIALVAIALGLFLLLARVAPDFMDSLLYTEEELRIINF